MNNLRLSFWLFALDAIAFYGGFGGRLYTWALRKASDATHWRNSP